MRGKLRDKRIKYDGFKQESIERKRPGKREVRMSILFDQESEELDSNFEREGDEETELDDQNLIYITKLTQK
jgi:hypothetical protein